MDGSKARPSCCGQMAIAIGFLRLYTTSSTFTYETMRLVEGGSSLLALANVLGSVGVGLLSAIGDPAMGWTL